MSQTYGMGDRSVMNCCKGGDRSSSQIQQGFGRSNPKKSVTTHYET
ncbi:MAG: hypothetical protein KME20_11575 [Kaiparowitsia implicata GSE-PSE-MK54-09C]|nr:hypothetical protein [Kaiparowitsia implicata GSE-PSE-MK54-09C]